jgi:hypothetical protein
MNTNQVLSIFLLVVLLSSVPALGAGSSTGANTDATLDRTDDTAANTDVATDRQARIQRHMERKAELIEEYRSANCEDADSLNRLQRIRCRLSKSDEEREYEAPRDTIPEACRRLTDATTDKKANPTACIALYKRARVCYDLEGQDKARCFRRSAGFTRAQLSDEDPTDRKLKSREYFVTLLYDIQENIEEKVAAGTIDPDAGAEMIDIIVEIKHQALNGASRSEILPLLNDLKQKWRDAMASEETEDE